MPMAATTKVWTLDELHRLPDDGNKYELVRGELFVTPAPTNNHEEIGARLHALLAPYIAAHKLGYVLRPRAIVRFDGSEVEPDLMVRAAHGRGNWDDAPLPILVVEVASSSTRRRDHAQKRAFYLDTGVTEYWIVDPEERSVTVVRRGVDDAVARDSVTWSPNGASEPLAIAVPALFTEPY